MATRHDSNLALTTRVLENNLPQMGLHLDAGETAFLSRDLEAVKARTYDVQYAALKARQFIPTSNDVDSAAETITYRVWDEYGMAEVIANYADDLPLADVSVREETTPVRSLGKGYQYSIQDIRRSAMAARNGNNASLDQKRAMAARTAVERAIDRIAAVGDADAGLPGFLNNANVPNVVLPNGGWASATSAQIIEDLNFMAQQIVSATLEVHEPDTLLLDTDSYAIIAQKPVAVDNQTTVLRSFLENNPYIKNIDQWTRLNTAGPSSTPRIVMYQRDPMVLELEVPQEFEQFPPQAKNLAFQIPCHARVGGTVIRYPLAIAYADNAD